MSLNPPFFAYLPPGSKFKNERSGRQMSFRARAPKDGTPARTPLVFLHGFNGSSKSWACQFAHFSDRRVIAIDAPGFGASDPIEGGMAAIADEVAALLSDLALPRAVIIGHSMGGMLAQVLAANHPGLCAALVLSCTHQGRGQPADTPLSAAVEERIRQRAELDDAAYGALRVRTMLAGETAPDVFAFLAAVAGEIREAGLRCGGLAMQHLDTGPMLGRIKAPIAIFTAETDIVVAPAAAAALAAGLPQARHVRLAGVGHAPYCEDAAAFNKAIEDFLMTVHDGPL